MTSRLRLHHLAWILPLALVVLAVACNGATATNPAAATNVNTNSGSTPGPGSTPAVGTPGGGAGGGFGTLSVRIKDSPFSEASALLVTFTEVSAHMAGTDTTEGEWVTLPFDSTTATSRTCDLKRLVTATDVLGTGTLAAGHYTQLRLTVSSATIYTTTTTTGDVCAEIPTLTTTTPPEVGISVVIPSGTLKLNREFTVPAAGTTTILIDFDGDKSVHKTGNGKYMMTPVIGIVSVQ